MHHIASLFLPWLHSPHDCVGQPGTYSAHCAANITHEPIAQEMCALLALPSTLNTPQRPQPLYCPTSHIDVSVRFFFVSRRSTMMGSKSITLVTVHVLPSPISPFHLYLLASLWPCAPRLSAAVKSFTV